MISAIAFAMILCTSQTAQDTSLTSALILVVDTAATLEGHHALKDRTTYVDRQHFVALAGGVAADTVSLPGNWVLYDQETAIAECRLKDGGCSKPGEAYVRIRSVTTEASTLIVFGTIRYHLPYDRTLPGPHPRGVSDTSLRVFTVRVQRSPGGWTVTSASANQGG